MKKKQERKKYLPSYSCNNANTFKFNELFSSCNIVVLEKLCKLNKPPPPPQKKPKPIQIADVTKTFTSKNKIYIII